MSLLRPEPQGDNTGFGGWLMAGTQARLVTACFAVFVLLYFYELANFTFSIDEELAIYRHEPGVWLSQGRWGAYLIERFVMPHPIVPVVPLVLFGALLAAAVVRLCSVFEVEDATLCILGFAFVASFPTTFMIAEFARNAVGTGLTFLGAALCAQLFRGAEVRSAALFVATLAGTVAIYQSAVLLVATLCAGVILFETFRADTPLRVVLRRAMRLLALLLLGLAVYFVVNQLFLAVAARRASYLAQFWNPGLLREHTDFALTRLYQDVQRLYFGLWESGFGRAYGQFAFTLLAGALAFHAVWRRWRRKATMLACGTILLVVIALTPFLPHGLSASVPYRSILAAPFALWLLLVFGSKAPAPRRARTLLTIVLAVAVIQNWLALNQFFHAAKTVGLHDQIVATRLIERIARVLPPYATQGTIPIVVFGSLPFNNDYSFKGFTAAAGSSFFEWDDGNPRRIAAYLRYLGLGPFVPADAASLARLRSLAAKLPPWPAEGCVAYVEGAVLMHFPGPSSSTPGTAEISDR